MKARCVLVGGPLDGHGWTTDVEGAERVCVENDAGEHWYRRAGMDNGRWVYQYEGEAP